MNGSKKTEAAVLEVLAPPPRAAFIFMTFRQHFLIAELSWYSVALLSRFISVKVVKIFHPIVSKSRKRLQS